MRGAAARQAMMLTAATPDALVLQEAGLRPHRVGPFSRSPDREFREKLIDVVGLYMDPPENAIVLCVDEKTRLQALETARSLCCRCAPTR